VPRRRLAVALLLPDALALVVAGVRRALGGDRAHVAPHLTLVPPVNVREESVVDALAVLRAAAATVEPFDLDIGPAATFHPVTPVLYLAVRGALDTLDSLRSALFVPPLERDVDHDFVPHVTLAEELEPSRLEAACVALADYDARLPARSITLLEDRAPGPHRWNAIAEARLGDGGRAWE
jgi:2'-5' RNA ligase